MKISNRHNVAVEFLASIAEGRVSLRAIAARSDVSLTLLEHLAADLRRGGLVRSTRGPGGGYELTRPLSEIELVDVLRVVGMKDEGKNSALLKTILHSLSGITVAQAFNTASA